MCACANAYRSQFLFIKETIQGILIILQYSLTDMIRLQPYDSVYPSLYACAYAHMDI